MGSTSAAVAQLGERETEDLKVTSSILVRGNIFMPRFSQLNSTIEIRGFGVLGFWGFGCGWCYVK